MGGCGKRGPRSGWHIPGGASQWRFQASHRGGFGGIAKKAGSLTADASADSSKGWGAEEVIAQRSGPAARSGKTAGTSDARGSSVPTALDMQKRRSGCEEPSFVLRFACRLDLGDPFVGV